MTIDLDILEASLRGMSPTPWRQCGASGCKCGLIWSLSADLVTANVVDRESGCSANNLTDAAGIVALVNAAPELIRLARSAGEYKQQYLALAKLLDSLETHAHPREED